MDTAGTQPAAAASFDQLEILAHVESDRFCDKCAYNLRGQPVRREPGTQLVLCRCPECATFHPAHHTAGAFSPWVHRLSIVAMILWLLTIAWLGFFSLAGQFGVMGATLDELGRPRHYYYYGNIPGAGGGDLDAEEEEYIQRWKRAQVILRIMAIAGSAAIGFVSCWIWTVIFPHWKMWAYGVVAVIVPLLCVVGISILIYIDEFRWLPAEWGLLLFLMFSAHAAGGTIAGLIGRPMTRGLLTLLLPPNLRTTFAYLWLADGKKPPHAKRHGLRLA